MMSKEVIYDKVYESPRSAPTVTLINNWQKDWKHNAAASSSSTEPIQLTQEYQSTGTEKPVAADEGVHSHIIDFRIQGLPHSSVEEAEHLRVRELLHQIENHPHRDELQADLMQDNVYIRFSENSKKMIHDMWNVEFFELCETTSKVQCSCGLSYWTKGIVCCTCGNCLRHTDSTRKLNRERFDTLSISNCVIKKGSPHGSRHGKTEEQRLCHTAKTRGKGAERRKNPQVRSTQVHWTDF